MSDDDGRSRWQYEHDMRVWESERAARINLFAAQGSIIADFASLAIKSIILANSAAAGAVLAFLATMWGKPQASQVAGPALECVQIFAAGAFAAMVSASLSYLTQYLYAVIDMSEEGTRQRKWCRWAAYPLHVLAVLSAAFGVATFAWGAWRGVEALAAANGGVVYGG